MLAKKNVKAKKGEKETQEHAKKKKKNAKKGEIKDAEMEDTNVTLMHTKCE